MIVGGVDIRWAPRLRPEKLRRLYEMDARGIVDEELLNEVAFALYARCDSILTVTESIWGKTKCPRCAYPITRGEDGQLLCPECSWQATAAEYHKTWEHQQLNGTNAREVFQDFVRRLPLVKTPQEKMRLIDWLIHECHRDARRGTLGRRVAKNLIEGSSRTIRELLEGLAYGDQAPAVAPGE
jgi:uncharacterized Zn finger protein (UPF0148 family)